MIRLSADALAILVSMSSGRPRRLALDNNPAGDELSKLGMIDPFFGFRGVQWKITDKGRQHVRTLNTINVLKEARAGLVSFTGIATSGTVAKIDDLLKELEK